jgi:hypothetical protein
VIRVSAEAQGRDRAEALVSEGEALVREVVEKM